MKDPETTPGQPDVERITTPDSEPRQTRALPAELPRTPVRSEPLFLERESYRRKRAMDGAHLLPLLGLTLFLLPVLIGPAERPGNETSGGLLYLFGVWVLLTGFAFWLSRYLKDPKDDRKPRDDGSASTDPNAVKPAGRDAAG